MIVFYRPTRILDRLRLRILYRTAFPRSERKPFSIIRKMQREGRSDVWCFRDGATFLGLATTINGDDKVLIDYFAVARRMRGRGHGGEMLRALIEHYSPRGVFLEIEIPYPDAKNAEERRRRKSFYVSAGMTPTETRFSLFGVDMELMCSGCELDFDEYRRFYLENYGKFAYDHIKPLSENK